MMQRAGFVKETATRRARVRLVVTAVASIVLTVIAGAASSRAGALAVPAQDAASDRDRTAHVHLAQSSGIDRVVPFARGPNARPIAGVTPPGSAATTDVREKGIIAKDPRTGEPLSDDAPPTASARGIVTVVDGVLTDTRAGIEPRQFTDPPFGAIGIIVVTFANGVVEQGTGFLVDPGIVLTAGHVLHSPAHGPARKVQFTPGCRLSKNVPTQYADARHIRVSPAWRTRDNSINSDYGAIFLPDRSVYVPCGSFALAAVAGSFVERHVRLKTTDFMIAGFPAEKPVGTMWLGSGRLRASASAGIRHLIDTTPGQSGAPLFSAIIEPVTRKKIPLAVGIHSRQSQGTKANEARRIDAAVIADLRRWAAEFGAGLR